MLPGEKRSAAVERVYAGGWTIGVDDGDLVIEPIPGPVGDHTVVSRAERAWMLRATEIMQVLRPGWLVVHELREPGRRWPWLVQLEHPDGSMWIELWSEHITFRWVNDSPVDDDEWAFWWRTIRRFAALPSAIFEPDSSELVATSMSARAARDRYNWL